MTRTVLTGHWEGGRYFYDGGRRRFLTTTPHWGAGRIGKTAANQRGGSFS